MTIQYYDSPQQAIIEGLREQLSEAQEEIKLLHSLVDAFDSYNDSDAKYLNSPFCQEVRTALKPNGRVNERGGA